MAVPKIKRMIIAVKILGAAEGFRPSAWMLANPPAARIADGPRMANAKIKSNAASRFNSHFPRTGFILERTISRLARVDGSFGLSRTASEK